MYSGKFELVRMGDVVHTGRHIHVKIDQLRILFDDRIDLEGKPHETPEDAFLASLIGGRNGHYTLREGRSGWYILSRLDQPVGLEKSRR
jgi:hypothetical protein